ncbi:hypothetical protein RRG08_021395 [Elysia crispata]|uniref:Copper transport protein n=1 Tax=Elysia crispata TaxID=231223 RepID=A0AAE1DBV1_9GAST|nr:hypothetical protein RRG08_021395 [Elysia crispata]
MCYTIIKMFFNANYPGYIWISRWRIKSEKELAWACLAATTLAAVYVALKYLALHFNRKYSHLAKIPANLPTMPSDDGRHCSRETNIDGSSETSRATAPTACAESGANGINVTSSVDFDTVEGEEVMENVGKFRLNEKESRIEKLPFSSSSCGTNCCRHAFLTTLYVLQVTLNYGLMLLFMTFNIWLCLALVLGAGLGHWLVAWRGHGQGSKRLSQPVASSSHPEEERSIKQAPKTFEQTRI